MHFFDGLYNYEIVMLVLGVLLFLVALIKLIKKVSAGLVVFFLLAIAMIGYPSIQSIQYQKGVFSLNKNVHDLEAQPGNQALRVSVQQDLGKIEARPGSDSANLTIATARFALGDEAAAKAKLAAVKNTDSADAKELNQKIELSDKLKALSARVETAPEDTAAKAQLHQAVSQAGQLRIANPKLLQSMDHAQALLKAQPATQLAPGTTQNLKIQKRIPTGALQTPPQ